MRLFKICVGITFAFCSITTAYAEQSFDDYVRSQMEEFQQFKDERDREFSAFLKERWIEVETSKPQERIDEPKPFVIPVAPPTVEEIPAPVPKPEKRPVPIKKPETIPSKEDVPTPIPDPQVKPELAPQIVPQPVPVVPDPLVVIEPLPKPAKPEKKVDGNFIQFLFYGNEVRISYDKALKLGLNSPITGTDIAKFWEQAALADYEPFVIDLMSYRDKLKLNDWGFILLINEAAERLAQNSNAKVLLSWFVLSKAGYETRTAYNSSQVYLLVPAKSMLYGVSFFNFDDKRYFVISADGFVKNLGNVYTYKKNYPDAENLMEFRVSNYPALGRKVVERDLSFTYKGKTYDIKVPYNLNEINYFRYHPQTEVTIYAEAGLSDWSGQILMKQLVPILEGKSESEAVNILLRFVQTAFKYKTDDEQFGYEKFFFAVESLYYPYSDCEDRSVLFSYLVKNMLGLDLVFLNYPGHIATGVALKERVGETVNFGNKVYTVADPTYINANAGMVMPQFKGVAPKISKF
jgi:hypothetical protein